MVATYESSNSTLNNLGDSSSVIGPDASSLIHRNTYTLPTLMKGFAFEAGTPNHWMVEAGTNNIFQYDVPKSTQLAYMPTEAFGIVRGITVYGPDQLILVGEDTKPQPILTVSDFGGGVVNILNIAEVDGGLIPNGVTFNQKLNMAIITEVGTPRVFEVPLDDVTKLRQIGELDFIPTDITYDPNSQTYWMVDSESTNIFHLNAEFKILNNWDFKDLTGIAPTSLTGIAMGPSGLIYIHTDEGAAYAAYEFEFNANTKPVAYDDTYTAVEDQTLSVSTANGVINNDIDGDGDPLTVSKLTNPTYGSLTLASDGSFTYTPIADFNGVDSFNYRLSDGEDTSNAKVTIDVSPVNDAPVAVEDRYDLIMNDDIFVSATYGVLENDNDIDSSSLSAILVSSTTYGTLDLFSNGSFYYSPNTNFAGTDSFEYKVSDGTSESNSAYVYLYVDENNTAPIGNDDSYTIIENSVLYGDWGNHLLLNDSDPDGDQLRLILDQDVKFGTLSIQSNGSFTYTPNTDFIGVDKFSYNLTDEITTSGPYWVTIEVQEHEKPPAPVDLSSDSGNGEVHLSWIEPSYAVLDQSGWQTINYTIYRADLSGGTYSKIGHSETTSYTDFDVTNDEVYYYVVTVVAQKDGETMTYESSYSNEVTGTPTAGNDNTTLSDPSNSNDTISEPEINLDLPISSGSIIAGIMLVSFTAIVRRRKYE